MFQQILAFIWLNAEKLSAITVSISLITTAVMVILTMKYARSTARQAQSAIGSSALRIFELISDDLNSKESRSNRRFVYTCGLSPEEIYTNELAREKVESVCAALDRVGAIVRNDLMPKGPARELYFDMYVDVFIRCWEKLKDYIKFMRNTKGHNQHYRNFAKLAKMALHHRTLFFC